MIEPEGVLDAALPPSEPDATGCHGIYYHFSEQETT